MYKRKKEIQFRVGIRSVKTYSVIIFMNFQVIENITSVDVTSFHFF
jgi:hypothetical protein